MRSLLCFLFVIPLILAPLYLLARLLVLAKRRMRAERREQDAPVEPVISLDEACREALGDCAALDTLQNMSVDRVRALLRASSNGPRPIPDDRVIATWRVQARLFLAGDFVGLRRYQRAMFPDQFPPNVRWRDERTQLGSLDRLVSIVLVLAAAVLLAIAYAKNWCGCKAPPKVGMSLPADQLFEYNKSEIIPPVRERIARLIREAVRDRRLAALTIQGYTDPVGGHCVNRALATDRALKVKALLSDAGIDTTNAVIDGKGASPKDRDIWAYCRANFDEAVPAEVKPLAVVVAAPACPADAADRYGELMLAPADALKDPKQVSQLRLNQLRLISCLSAMRRVEFTFDDRSRQPGEAP